jgi:hypothetical protein
VGFVEIEDFSWDCAVIVYHILVGEESAKKREFESSLKLSLKLSILLSFLSSLLLYSSLFLLFFYQVFLKSFSLSRFFFLSSSLLHIFPWMVGLPKMSYVVFTLLLFLVYFDCNLSFLT